MTESGLCSFTGAQQIPRVSCFKGGAHDGETSWRDRLSDEEKRKLQLSSLDSDQTGDNEQHQRHSQAPDDMSTVGSGDSITSFDGGEDGSSESNRAIRATRESANPMGVSPNTRPSAFAATRVSWGSRYGSDDSTAWAPTLMTRVSTIG